MIYCQNVMGVVVAALGTALVWITRVTLDDAPVWPAILATLGFWFLGLLLTWLKKP
jgi:hypothetical protein